MSEKGGGQRKMWAVYKITNKINGKGYIGFTKNSMKYRFKQHIKDSKIKNRVLSRAIRKYGEHSFEICVLDSCSTELEARQSETELIKSYSTNKIGYNMTVGGEAPTGFHNHENRVQNTPDWAFNNFYIQEFLLKAFPKLQEDKNQRKRAGRWARIIYLYYRLGFTSFQIAEEMIEEPHKIHSTIQKIINVTNGKTTHGTKRGGTKPRGRPKKNTLVL